MTCFSVTRNSIFLRVLSRTNGYAREGASSVGSPVPVYGSSGLGLQVPAGASSISTGPIMSGAIQNTEQIETGPSISFGAGLLFGYQITRSGGQQIGGPTILPDPGASTTYTSGKCASIP